MVLQVRPGEVRDLPTPLHIVDVRSLEEYVGDDWHLPGAELIPLERLPQALHRLDPARRYLMVCRSGRRSLQAAELLSARGFAHVYNLEGGVTAWNALAA